MSNLDELPALKIAAIELAYDNGIVDRDHPLEVFLADTAKLLAETYNSEQLYEVNAMIGLLSKESIVDLVAGDEDQQAAALNLMPEQSRELVDRMLETIFEGGYSHD